MLGSLRCAKVGRRAGCEPQESVRRATAEPGVSSVQAAHQLWRRSEQVGRSGEAPQLVHAQPRHACAPPRARSPPPPVLTLTRSAGARALRSSPGTQGAAAELPTTPLGGCHPWQQAARRSPATRLAPRMLARTASIVHRSGQLKQSVLPGALLSPLVTSSCRRGKEKPTTYPGQPRVYTHMCTSTAVCLTQVPIARVEVWMIGYRRADARCWRGYAAGCLDVRALRSVWKAHSAAGPARAAGALSPSWCPCSLSLQAFLCACGHRGCCQCSRPRRVCLCATLPASPLCTAGRVIVLQHPLELKCAARACSTEWLAAETQLAATTAFLFAGLPPYAGVAAGSPWRPCRSCSSACSAARS